MSREYARRSRGGGNLPLIIAIIGTVIVIAVILYFLLGNGGGLSKEKETDSPEISAAPQTDSPTPGPTATIAPSPTLALIVTSEAPAEIITTAPPTPTPAPSYATATIWANDLNVREGPGLDYAKVGSVKRGEYFKVWEETSKWLKIQMTNGVFGWVWRDYCVRGDAALPAAPTKEPEPSFLSKAEFTGSNTIRVTFTENVWGNSAKTDNVPATVFAVKEGSATISITGISVCNGGTYVDLTVGNTSGGTVTVTLAKNGVYNTAGEGTPAGSYTINTSSDTVAPTATISVNLNLVTVTFSEAVYTNSNGTGDLVAGDFSVYASAGSPTISAPVKNGNAYQITLTYSGMSGGDTADTTFKVLASSVYDAGGNPCSETTKTFTYTYPTT